MPLTNTTTITDGRLTIHTS